MTFKPTYLYIKQHEVTGLLYFGKTTNSNPVSYKGSGKYWKQHLKAHPGKIKTIWLEQFLDQESLKEFADFFSNFFDITNSGRWANLRPENGIDGGVIGEAKSLEHRQKISNALRGKKHSKERKAAISVGTSQGMKNAETRKKIARALTGKILPHETKQAISNSLMGKRKTIEHAKAISEGRKKMFEARK